VRRAHHAAGRADVIVHVADASRPETWASMVDADLHVMNKLDLVPAADVPSGFLSLSAHTGAGIEDLRQRLGRLLGDADWGEETLLVTRERHRTAIAQARDSVLQGVAMLGDEQRLDLVALEWRRAWATLGGILGMGDVDDILDRVFADFCIGK